MWLLHRRVRAVLVKSPLGFFTAQALKRSTKPAQYFFGALVRGRYQLLRNVNRPVSPAKMVKRVSGRHRSSLTPSYSVTVERSGLHSSSSSAAGTLQNGSLPFRFTVGRELSCAGMKLLGRTEEQG
jgi:hypothetical protein